MIKKKTQAQTIKLILFHTITNKQNKIRKHTEDNNTNIDEVASFRFV